MMVHHYELTDPEVNFDSDTRQLTFSRSQGGGAEQLQSSMGVLHNTLVVLVKDGNFVGKSDDIWDLRLSSLHIMSSPTKYTCRYFGGPKTHAWAIRG